MGSEYDPISCFHANAQGLIGRGYIGNICFIVFTKLQGRGKIKLLTLLNKTRCHEDLLRYRVHHNSTHFSFHYQLLNSQKKTPIPPHTQHTEGSVRPSINLEILRREKSHAMSRMKLQFFNHIPHGHYYTDTAPQQHQLP